MGNHNYFKSCIFILPFHPFLLLFKLFVPTHLDLSWGGLTDWPKRDANGNIMTDANGKTIFEETPWFKSLFPNSSDRERIKNNIAIEQTGKDINGNRASKKG